MSGLTVVIDERVEELAHLWETSYGAPLALRMALTEWFLTSEAVSRGYARALPPEAVARAPGRAS